MTSPRELMDEALKAKVVPSLRSDGFTGSYPHFRRLRESQVDLLTFQFDRYGGGFLIEVSRCGLEGITTHSGKHIEASRVRAWDLHPNARLRIKPRAGAGTDSWFRYDDGQYDSVADAVLAKLTVAHDYWSQRV
jgi:hypothetical protein